MFEYVIAGPICSAFTCWYLFWPGLLLAIGGIAWLRHDPRAREKAALLRRWQPRRIRDAFASPAPTTRERRVATARRASLALLAAAPLLLATRILLTPTGSSFDVEGFWDWPKWFTSDALVVLPRAHVGLAALVVAARHGTRRATACVALGSALLLFAFAADILRDHCAMCELGFVD